MDAGDVPSLEALGIPADLNTARSQGLLWRWEPGMGAGGGCSMSLSWLQSGQQMASPELGDIWCRGHLLTSLPKMGAAQSTARSWELPFPGQHLSFAWLALS